jgi:hypothetical protein
VDPGNERGLPAEARGLPAAGEVGKIEPASLVPVAPAARARAGGGAGCGRRGDGRARSASRVGGSSPGRACPSRVARLCGRARCPSGQLRRQPNAHEIAAAVDFRALDDAHAAATNSAQALYLQTVIPAQVKALGEQVTTTKAGTPRKRLTRAAMAKLSAPEGGRDELVELLLQAARGGAAQAVAEIAEQGRELAMPVTTRCAPR